MKISPITYKNYPILNNKNNATDSVGVDSVSFVGKRMVGDLKKANHSKNIVKGVLASLGGVFTISKIEPTEDDEKEFENLYLALNTLTVDKDTFKDFYKHSPKMAKTLVRSKRIAGLYDITLLRDVNTDDFTENKYLALEGILGASHKNQRPVFNIFDITTKYIDSLEETLVKAIVKHKAELNEIFSNVYPTLNAGQDYLDTAIVLERSSDLTPEEMQMYFLTMSDYNLNSMLNWAKSDIKIRNEVLKQLNENRCIDEYIECVESPIIPTQNLLDKIDLLTEYAQKGKRLKDLIKHPEALLDEKYTAVGIKNGIERLESLSPQLFEDVKKTNMGDIIAFFDVYKQDGSLVNDADLEDYLWLAENASKYLSERQKYCLLDSESLFNLPHNELKNEGIFKENASIINITKINSSTSAKMLLDILLTPEMFDRMILLGEIFDGSMDEIIKELEYKCRNKNPVFLRTAKKFLEDKNYMVDIISNPGMSKNDIIENLFHMSKIRSLIAENPEKYINDKNYGFSDLEICYLSKYLKLGNQDEKAAEEYLSQLDSFLQQKIMLACMRINYDKSGFNYLYGAMSTTDSEYINMLLSKRMDRFWREIYDIYNLPYKTKNIISNLIHHAKNKSKTGETIKLSGIQKDIIVKYIPTMQKLMKNDLSELIKKYSTYVGNKGNFIFDLDGFLDSYKRYVFEKLGYNQIEQVINEEALSKWDKKYVHLLLTPNIMDEGELKLVFDLITKGEFNSYIKNPKTEHGKSNLITRKIYQKLGIDYKTWIEGISSEELELSGRKYKIGLIDRAEPNMVFMGNYTSCCTALNEDKGDSVPNYLLNTAFNIIGVRDEQGDLVSTSRIFISSETKGKPVLIIDNIEISNKLRAVLKDDTSQEFVKNIWDYINSFSRKLSKKELPIYMSKKYPKIKLPERQEIVSSIKLAGDVTKTPIYINTIGERVNPRESYSCELIDVFNKN